MYFFATRTRTLPRGLLPGKRNRVPTGEVENFLPDERSRGLPAGSEIPGGSVTHHHAVMFVLCVCGVRTAVRFCSSGAHTPAGRNTVESMRETKVLEGSKPWHSARLRINLPTSPAWQEEPLRRSFEAGFTKQCFQISDSSPGCVSATLKPTARHLSHRRQKQTEADHTTADSESSATERRTIKFYTRMTQHWNIHV